MKKILCAILAVAIAMSVCACSSTDSNSVKGTNSTIKPSTEQPTNLTKSQLDAWLDAAKEVEDLTRQMVAYQVDYGWRGDYCFKFMFSQEEYNKISGSDMISSEINSYRKKAREKINKINSNYAFKHGDGEYYKSVNEYFKAVEKFYAFSTTVPSSQSSFLKMGIRYVENCEDAYLEAEMSK